MAGMFITRSAIFRFSKSLPYAPSLSHKPFTVTFASSPNSSDNLQWRNAAEGKRDLRYDSAEANEMGERAFDRAKDEAREAEERTKEYAEDVKKKTKDAAGTVADKSKEGAEKTKEVAGSTTETLKKVGEKTKQGVQGAWETAKDTTQKIKDTVVGKDEDNDNDNDHDHDHGDHGGLKAEDVPEFKTRVRKSYGE